MDVPNVVKRGVSESAVVGGLEDVLERWAVGIFPIGCVFVGDENRPHADFETGYSFETIAGTLVLYTAPAARIVQVHRYHDAFITEISIPNREFRAVRHYGCLIE